MFPQTKLLGMQARCAKCGQDTRWLYKETRKSNAFCSADCRMSFYGIRKIERQCKHCEKPFTCNESNELKIFCSQECGHKSRKNKAKIDRECAKCSKPIRTAFEHQRYCSAKCRQTDYHQKNYKTPIRPATYEGICTWCNKTIIQQTPFFHWTKYHKECSKQAQRARYRLKTIKRQGAYSGTRISVDQIAERDGFICYLCQDKVRMDLPRLSPNGATVDHIIPISRGGLDTLDNIKLAHWKCNRAKGTKLVEELNA